MISFQPGVLIEKLDELPTIQKMESLYLDFETTSGNDKEKSINPWKHCDILGFNWSWDDHPTAYYVPIAHRDSRFNLDRDACLFYLRSLLEHTECNLIGHNLKYDVHVALNYGGVDPESIYRLNLLDTRTLAKIINSDRMEYSMSGLSRDWLYNDIRGYEKELKRYTHNKSMTAWRIHDYAIIPADVMAPYACQDIQTTRQIYKYIQENLPEDCWDTYWMETELTKELIRIERTGIRLDVREVVKDGIERVPALMETIEDKLHELTGEIFRPNVNQDCHNIICTQYGMPIMEWTKGSKDKEPEPSFGKEALKAYMAFETDVPNFHRIISLISRFRKWYKIQTAFLYPYMGLCKKHDSSNVRLHTDYNQAVRTGRMASAKPNTQQVPRAARRYIIPDDGCVLIDFDLKQIEYRCIADLIEDPYIIEEYQSDPNADFHDAMAKRCGIDRASAKTMNFGVSFGAGEKKTILMFRKAVDPESVPEEYTFEQFCDIRGKEIFKAYHAAVPRLKDNKNEATEVAKRRGYVKNKFGRRRHLPRRFCYRAFNTAAQGWAADIMKRITLNLQKLFRERGVEEIIFIVAIIHDSWLVNCPANMKDEWIPLIKKTIESTETRMTVPMYASYDTSKENWAKCK